MKEWPGPEFPRVSSFNLSEYKLPPFMDLAFPENLGEKRSKTLPSP